MVLVCIARELMKCGISAELNMQRCHIILGARICLLCEVTKLYMGDYK